MRDQGKPFDKATAYQISTSCVSSYRYSMHPAPLSANVPKRVFQIVFAIIRARDYPTK